MAIEAYIVAFDIQEASSFQYREKAGTGTNSGPGIQEKLGAKEEVTVGGNEYESNGLASQGIKGPVAQAFLTECLAGSAEEAVEVVHKQLGRYSGKCRAVVKPNTNFKPVDK